MPADLNFFMTSHRKGENNSAGADIKNAVWRKILQNKAVVQDLESFVSVAKEQFPISPLKGLNQMKYVMQQNKSLNATRNILSTFPAHKNSITSPLKTRKLVVSF